MAVEYVPKFDLLDTDIQLLFQHIFCKTCLTTWAAQKSECPLCKSQCRRIQSGYDPVTKEWQIEETIKGCGQSVVT